MIHIVVPMAGRGSRFATKNYDLPKPLLPIHGKSMIQVVTNNLRPKEEYQFIYLCLREHLEKYGVEKQLRSIEPNCKIVAIDQVTKGAACTVLLAKEYINNRDPLIIANSDQWIDFDINEFVKGMNKDKSLGLIMTMIAHDPKWSYVRLGPQNEVTEVIEKQVISDYATVGIYGFRHGSDYVAAAEKMIAKNFMVNGEFYVAPTYNEMIAEGKRIDFLNIGDVDSRMYGIGIPEDYESFLKKPISLRAAGVESAALTDQLSLIIPLYNEEKNIPALIAMLNSAPLSQNNVREVLLVNNGSKDHTAEALKKYVPDLGMERIVTLEVNRGYGGGVFAGLQEAKSPFLAFIPGDLQVSAEDFLRVWKHYREWMKSSGQCKALFKGRRTIRKDSVQMQFTSKCYTEIANGILGTTIRDFNGLPKIFHRSLLDHLPKERMTSFTFDAQILLAASELGWKVEEIPVSFLARREGVSSWSGKRMQVYVRTFLEIMRLKKLHAARDQNP